MINAKPGDKIYIRLSNDTIKHVELKEIKTHGIEGYNISLLKKALTFYPFHNILSISKNN